MLQLYDCKCMFLAFSVCFLVILVHLIAALNNATQAFSPLISRWVKCISLDPVRLSLLDLINYRQTRTSIDAC